MSDRLWPEMEGEGREWACCPPVRQYQILSHNTTDKLTYTDLKGLSVHPISLLLVANSDFRYRSTICIKLTTLLSTRHFLTLLCSLRLIPPVSRRVKVKLTKWEMPNLSKRGKLEQCYLPSVLFWQFPSGLIFSPYLLFSLSLFDEIWLRFKYLLKLQIRSMPQIFFNGIIKCRQFLLKSQDISINLFAIK